MSPKISSIIDGKCSVLDFLTSIKTEILSEKEICRSLFLVEILFSFKTTVEKVEWLNLYVLRFNYIASPPIRIDK